MGSGGYRAGADGAGVMIISPPAHSCGVLIIIEQKVENNLNSGFWISWYNLPEKGRDTYLSWLHESYIPAVLKRPGVLGAAHYASESNVRISGEAGRLRGTTDRKVPTGDRYILVFGGETPYAFANPAPSIYHAGLTAVDRKMLAMRLGERSNVMALEGMAYGPEAAAAKDDMTFMPGMQMGSFNAGALEDEDELMDWYATWRLPCMEKLPGCVRIRKLVSVSGWAKHAVFYEFVSVDARNQKFVDHENFNPEKEAWTDKVVRKLVHAPGSPNVAQRIWPVER